MCVFMTMNNEYLFLREQNLEYVMDLRVYSSEKKIRSNKSTRKA